MAVSVVVAIGSFAFTAAPAHAASTSTIDADGVDYDAACAGRPFPSGANGYASPGGVGCNNTALTSLYDGSTEATDLRSVSLASDTSGHIVATCEVDGTFPEPGSSDLFELDRPSFLFNGVGCKVMFQNKTVETYGPSGTVGGCTYVGTGRRSEDRHGSWKDGFHFFVGFEVHWNDKWIYTVQQGEYDPSPSGGFIYTELGANDGSGWQSSTPHAAHGTDWDVSVSGSGPTTITITAPGLLRVPDPVNCQEGYFTLNYASSGNVIANVKGLSTANVQGRDSAAMWFSDVTDGNSGAGLANTNINGVAFTHGAYGWPIGREATDVAAGVSHFWDTGQRYSGLEARSWDTGGWNSEACPTPTAQGTLPGSPLYSSDRACQYDDDGVSRGSALMEFWDTTHGFLF